MSENTTSEGWLIHKGKFIVWKHMKLAGKTDLSYRPHFELTVADKEKDQEIHFDNVQVKDSKLKDVRDLLALPAQVREEMLDNAVKALEHEYARA